jgi:aldehyde dehydrogenase (NAD(P)+)
VAGICEYARFLAAAQLRCIAKVEKIMTVAMLFDDASAFHEGRPPTSHQSMDRAIDRVRAGADRFARLTIKQRIALACSMQHGYAQVAEASVKAACKAKGVSADHAGEEWALGPWIAIRGFRLIIESLKSLARTGNTPVVRIGRTHDGRVSVGVFPGNALDKLLFSKVRVDVHMAPGVTKSDVETTRGAFYKSTPRNGKVVAILGGGNVEAIVSFDIMSKMFVEGKACVVKMNPANAWLGPYLERAFADPIARGFLAIVYGGADEGAYLAHHPEIDEVHLTGSVRAYDALVWGPAGYERELRKARGEPGLTKHVTAELGNVSPVIVVPCRYTEAELRYQAEEVAAALTMNASYVCGAPRLLITARAWTQRHAFLREIVAAFERAPARRPYYPGAVESYRLCTANRQNIRKIGAESDGVLPWTLITDVDPENRADLAFMREFFCPALFETALGGENVDEFLKGAVRFANERLWGTLSASLVVPNIAAEDRDLNAAVEAALRELRYGAVGVNACSAMIFAFGSPPWGAWPGSDPRDIQSGNGFVHNTSMLEGVEKVVMRHPLTTFPKPAYFPSHRSAARLMPKLTALDANANWLKAPGVIATAMRC